MALAFHFLGSPQLVLENLPVSVNRRSIVALLAYLSVEDSKQAGRMHTRESLSALLWPDYDQVKAFTNLRHTLWEIQKVFGPGWLLADRETIGLRPDANLWVDVQWFESLLLEGRLQRDVSTRIPLLTECVQLYRHHFLTGFSLKNTPTFDAWSLEKADDLRHKHTEALTLLAEDYCLLGDTEPALKYARRLVSLDPLNESAHRLLMQVYSQAGQHNAALKQYQQLEQTLRKEMGLDPRPETRALYKQIRKGDIKPVQGAIESERVAPQTNLPQQLTSFIGREKEQAEIVRLISSNRLVTLTGSGGVGKTRLSLQVATKMLHQFPDGVWFIELAPLANPNLIAQTILSTLRLGEQAGKTPLEVLEEQLKNKKLILILDNCEHLLEASANVVNTLLMASPEMKILVTSREVLGVKGELSWRAPSLALPDLKSALKLEQLTQYEAVRLFIDRALLVQPSFKANPRNAPVIAQNCSGLDGIPLAIEFAAARVKALTVDQIARRLDDRLRLLTRGSHTELDRHQTLRAAIDWSYNLLDTDEKKVLSRLTVFMGGWRLEAAEQVCVRQEAEFDVLEVLSDLIDKSLVIMDGSGVEARYRLLETTRQYGQEKLVESNERKEFHDRHLAYFVELAEKGNSEITGPHQAEMIDLLDAELDNFRAALDWCISNQYTEQALQMLGALGWAWDMRGYYHEVRSWFEKIRVLGECANYPEAYARLLNHLGRFAADFDRRPDAESILEESRAIWLRLGSRGEQGLADVLCFLGMDAQHKGNLDQAESFYKKSFAVAQKCNHQRTIAGSMCFLGQIEQQRGQMESVHRLYKQSLELSRRTGDLLLISISGGNLGDLLLEQGNYEKARLLFDQAVEINEKLQFRFGLAPTWLSMGELCRHEGNYIQAEQRLEKSMNVSRDLGLKELISYNLYLFGLLALHRNDYSSAARRFREYFDFARGIEEKVCLYRFFIGMSAVAGGISQLERCARLFGAAQMIIQSISDFQMNRFDCTEFDRHIQRAREQLGESYFDRLSNEGRSMSTEEAIDFALEVKILSLFTSSFK